VSAFELMDALAEPGCAVCRLSAASADKHVESLLWEGVNDPERREVLRRAQGFCHSHAWSLVRTGASLGSAIMMRDLLQNALGAMADAVDEAAHGAAHGAERPGLLRRVYRTLTRRRARRATASLVSRLEPQVACPACAWAEKIERIYVDTLVSSLLEEPGIPDALKASDGLCLPHLRQALARARGWRARGALLAAQRGAWGRLTDDLGEFIRKSDYRFHHEKMAGEEGNAWIRGIAAMAGARPKESLRK
jgi:hypothetical protein